MSDAGCALQELLAENAQLRARIAELETRLVHRSDRGTEPGPESSTAAREAGGACTGPESPPALPMEALPGPLIHRYSRQLLARGFGVDAQLHLCNGSALVVGAGGLGSAVLQCLVGAGVGAIPGLGSRVAR